MTTPSDPFTTAGAPAPNDHSAVLTLWFVTAAEPEKIVAASPKADRGFGRKLLAQLNPRWPISLIGQFSLNRSAQASQGEYYIAGFPGLAIIQTALNQAALLSELNPRLRSCIPAADVFAFTINERTGLGGFAHWKGGKLARSFSAKPDRVYEDIGLPEPFESPFWAAKKKDSSGIALPFAPIELVHAAQCAWLGFDPATSNDINVVAYAVDGRRETKLMPDPGSTANIGLFASKATAKLGIGTKTGYDDYERHDDYEPTGDELVHWLQSASDTLHNTRRLLGTGFKEARAFVANKARHTDRPTNKVSKKTIPAKTSSKKAPQDSSDSSQGGSKDTDQLDY